MGEIRKVYKVFLASPSDLKSERLLSKDLVDSLNCNVAKELGWQIDLFIWEEMSPCAGRPQEKINKYLDCDLFIGLLWKQWGDPSGNEYSSGFEEEFTIISQNYEKNGSPQIWLFFKEIDQEFLNDPGPQLQKVIDFKELIEKEKKFLYRKFKNNEEWGKIFPIFLSTELIRASNSEKEKGESKISSSNTISSTSSPVNGTTTPAMNNIKELIKALEKSTKDQKKFAILEPFQRSRLYLFSSALLYNYDINETIGTHEINFLFKDRKKIKSFYFEQELILRTIIKDSYNLKPGWYWFRKMTEKELTKKLITLFFYKSVSTDEELKIQCVKILNKIWSKSSQNVMWLLLKNNSANIIKEILNVLQLKGNKESLEYIDNYLVSGDASIEKEALRAKFSILVRCDHCEAINFLKGTKEYTDIEHNDIEKLTQNSNERELRSLLTNSNDKVQIFAYKELVSRNKLSKKELQCLLENRSLELKYYAYNKLIDEGERFEPNEICNKFASRNTYGDELMHILEGRSTNSKKLEEEVLLKLFKKYSKSELLKHIDFMSLTGPIAYKAVGINYFDSFQTILRKDIDNNFERIKFTFVKSLEEKIMEQLKAKISSDNVKKIEDASKLLAKKEMEKISNDIDNFVKNNFTHAALSVLLIKGHKNDAFYARKYLNSDNTEIKEIAVDILIRFGNDKDVSDLFNIAMNSSGSLKEKAAKTALLLDKDNQFNVINRFLNSNDPNLVKYCLNKDSNKHIDLKAVEKNLLNNNTEIRELCVSYLIKNLETIKISSLLSRYLKEKIYYYDVVCWLDRCLYAPKKLRKAFFEEIVGANLGERS